MFADDLHRPGDEVHEAREGDERRKREPRATKNRPSTHVPSTTRLAAAIRARVQILRMRRERELFPVKISVCFVMGAVGT